MGKHTIITVETGPSSDKICVTGTIGDGRIGVMDFYKYRDGKLHEYGETITENDIGERIARIVFGRRDAVKKMISGLSSLYEIMEDNDG